MILIDSSVWIDYFANRSSAQVTLLDSFLEEGEVLCICGVILTEVLQGIKNQREYLKVRRYFEELTFLPMNRETFLHAADIYRVLRQRGLTIRKLIDCMIAAVAIENGIPLLHNDRDFKVIQEHFPLKTPELPE